MYTGVGRQTRRGAPVDDPKTSVYQELHTAELFPPHYAYLEKGAKKELKRSQKGAKEELKMKLKLETVSYNACRRTRFFSRNEPENRV